MPKDKATKPKKPYAEFPLTAHGNGQWCKKIRGKVHFFGIHGDTDAALAKYLDERDDLQAGRIPQRLSSVVVDVGSLMNLFLAQRDAQMQTGNLSPQMFVDYRDCAKMLIEHLGRSTAVETLAPQLRGAAESMGWPVRIRSTEQAGDDSPDDFQMGLGVRSAQGAGEAGARLQGGQHATDSRAAQRRGQ